MSHDADRPASLSAVRRRTNGRRFGRLPVLAVMVAATLLATGCSATVDVPARSSAPETSAVPTSGATASVAPDPSTSPADPDPGTVTDAPAADAQALFMASCLGSAGYGPRPKASADNPLAAENGRPLEAEQKAWDEWNATCLTRFLTQETPAP